MPGRLLNLQQRFEQSPLSSHESGSESQADHAPAQSPLGGTVAHPLYLGHEAVVLPSGLVSERRRMGLEIQTVYTRICAATRHAWASNSFTDATLLPDFCPHCLAEDEDAIGRERYRALHVRLTNGR